MLGFSRSAQALIVVGLAALAVVVALYVSAARRLAAARQARRDDDCAAAESHLAAVWRLPGLGGVAALEDKLLAVQQGDLSDEEAWQTRAGRASTESALILEALAKGNLAASQFNEARNYADAILQRQPDDAQALWLRGRAWIPLQQEDKALDDFERAIEREPAAFEVRFSLAELLHKLGHVRDAITHYERLKQGRPDDERVTLALAHCCEEQGQLDVARELLDSLLARQPHSVLTLVERGRLALRAGQPEDGEKWLRRAVELLPDHTEANFVLRLCLQAQGKSDAALERHIEENERRQAELRLKLHDSGERNPSLLTKFGNWIMRTGDEHEGGGWFYAALKEDRKHAAAHAGLAEYFERVGQGRSAAMHARLAGVTLNVKAKGATALTGASLSHPTVLTVGTAHPTEASSDDVHRLCAACHAYPPPESMPRAVWRKEVKQGYDLLRRSTLQGEFPALEDVVLYYEQRAPERLPLIEYKTATTKPPVKFQKRGTGWLANLPPFPGVANVNLARLVGGEKQELLLCDTRLDRVLVVKPHEPTPGPQALPQVIAPSHTAVTDLDGDGRQDVLVAGLGSFFPTDDKIGKVVWLRGLADGQFEASTLLEGVGRVSDVQAADFNGDGRLDLVVAVFGWRSTGEVLYLENRTSDWSRPEFARHIVDARHGAIHVPVVDLNGDGQPDFVALISQEHETVVAHLNRGDGTFKQETVFTAPHPTYGSSGIEVVDLDGDHDLDVLMTNGDVLDRPYLLKPYHSVQWLENKGSYPFEHHVLAPLHGASRAVAADFDGDHDLDVIAVSFLPRLEFPERESLRLPSVVLLEQTAQRQFQMHILETGACDHFSCAAGDWDGDGKIDLAVGNFSWKRSQAFGDAAVMWRNASGE